MLHIWTIPNKLESTDSIMLYKHLTKLLWQVEEWLWFAELAVRGSPQSDPDSHRPLNGQVVEGWSLEHDGILMVDIVWTKTTFGTPRLDWVDGIVVLLFIEENLNVI